MGLARAGAANQNDVALMGQELSPGQIRHQALVDWRVREDKVLEVLGKGLFSNRHQPSNDITGRWLVCPVVELRLRSARCQKLSSLKPYWCCQRTHGWNCVLKSSTTVESASGRTLTAPAKG